MEIDYWGNEQQMMLEWTESKSSKVGEKSSD